MSTPLPLRVATYNVHKCQGLDRRTSPARIASIVRDLNADILCLQEVVNAPASSLFNQANELASALPGHTLCFGANRPLRGGTYGNLTLSRFPILSWRNHDLTSRREERGVLETLLELPNGQPLRVFNIHLGTSLLERRRQARLLLQPHLLGESEADNQPAPRLLLGDFNEWTRGLTTRLLRSSFQTFRPRHAAGLPGTFPGLLPLFTLDHCYYEPPLQLLKTRLFRTRTALVASDHLPLVADFTVSRSPTPASP